VFFTRILGGVGRTMIAAGVLILLFVAFQLWGTGIRTEASQRDLASQFAQEEAQLHGGTALPGESGSDLGSQPSTTPATPAGGGTTTSTAPAATGSLPAFKAGDAIGQIRIPKIDADFQMIEGVDLNDLSKGPGHFPNTPYPGQPGNAALAGHRVTWLAPFNRIDELAPGDDIYIHTLQGDFTYQVMPQPGPNGTNIGYKIIWPTQTEILDQPKTPGVNTLTLMACHPKFDLTQRIVVVAKLVDNPAPATPRSTASNDSNAAQSALLGGSGGDLVGGDTDARMPALIFSLVAAAIWLVAWLLTKRWRGWRHWQKWAVYLVALPIFLVPLFFAFENINHLLPAGY
jgi:sortase A